MYFLQTRLTHTQRLVSINDPVRSINQRRNLTSWWDSKCDILVSLPIGRSAIALTQPLAHAFWLGCWWMDSFHTKCTNVDILISHSWNIHITSDCWLKSWRMHKHRSFCSVVFVVDMSPTHQFFVQTFEYDGSLNFKLLSIIFIWW